MGVNTPSLPGGEFGLAVAVARSGVNRSVQKLYAE
jgi:hypothetical protein